MHCLSVISPSLCVYGGGGGVVSLILKVLHDIKKTAYVKIISQEGAKMK